jgi:predicted O-linked N-acetylglucosamine transferase (SPINDLY family)
VSDPNDLSLAFRLHQAGNLADAQRLYDEILQTQPNHVDALHLRGVIAWQSGANDLAVDLIGRAIELNPGFAESYSNLGNALKDLGRLDEAVEAYHTAIKLKPDLAEACFNLGNTLIALGKADEAVPAFRRAVKLKPDYVAAHLNLGNALYAQGKFDAAVGALRKALALNPDLADAQFSLGKALYDQGASEEAEAAFRRCVALKPDHLEALAFLSMALKDQGKLDEAVEAYRDLLALKPDFAEAHYNLGNLLSAQGELEEAIAAYRETLRLKPGYAAAYNNLGNALRDQGKLEEAVASYREALELKPDIAEVHNNLGIALRNQGKLEAAVASYREALELNPGVAAVHSNLGNALWNQGKLEEAIAALRKALELEPDHAAAHNNLGNALGAQGKLEEAIAAYRKTLELKPDDAGAHSNLLLTLNYVSGMSDEALFAEHLKFDEQHARRFTAHIQPYRNDRDPGRRLRIGYVSPDFHHHAAAYLIEPILERHEHDHFEVFCYYNDAQVDEVTERLRRYADHWIDCVGMTDDMLADRVRGDEIDILVDLAGHTANNRLLVFARKPAPVQVTWIGYPSTTGLATMDYRFSDTNVDPIGKSEQFYTEELVRLPVFSCFRPPSESPKVGDLPALKAGHVTFTSFNKFNKITLDVMALWAEILRTVKDSRLIIMSVNDGEMERYVRQTFSNNGVLESRLTLMGRIPHSEFLEIHNSVDIGLDTFPYNGGTTTRMSAWMGVPHITLAGTNARSRVGAAFLVELGHPELIAITPEEYVERAVELAKDIGRLQEIRSGLRDRMTNSPLANGESLTRSVERAYRKMWRRYCGKARSVGGDVGNIDPM